MRFDDIFGIIGGLGKYQILLVLLLLMIVSWPSPVITIVYTLLELPHWCLVPGLEHLPYVQQKLLAIPFNQEKGAYEQCVRYDLNVSILNGTEEEDLSELHNVSSIIPCGDWVFDHSDYGTSLVEKIGFVCDKRYLKSIGTSMYFVGLMVGNCLSGYISDRFGRKPTLFAMLLLCNIFWLVIIFSPNAFVFAVGRFFIGLSRVAVFTSVFVLCMELVGVQWRALLGSMANLGFAVGYMFTSGIAYGFKDGLHFDLFCVLPTFVFFVLYFVLPESPRWLLVNEKGDEASRVLRKIAKGNGRPCPDLDHTEIKVDKDGGKNGNILDIFRHHFLRKQTLILAFYWFAVNLSYYTLTLSSGELIPGNFYLNNFLLAAVELPGIMIGLALSNWNRCGRRWANCIFPVLLGLCGLLIIPFSIHNMYHAVTALAILGKLFAAGSFNLTYVYTAELFPTEVRHLGLGVCAMIGRLGGILSSFTGTILMDIWKPLPYTLISIVILSGMFNLMLRETLNQPLHETIVELNHAIRKGHSKVNGEEDTMKDKKPLNETNS